MFIIISFLFLISRVIKCAHFYALVFLFAVYLSDRLKIVEWTIMQG